MALPTTLAVGDVVLSELLADYADAKKSCDDWHKNIQRWRSWYDFDHYQKRGDPKPGEQRYEDPTPTNIVDTAVGIILAKDLDWKAMGFTPDWDEVASTSQIEKYLAGLIAINDEREESDTVYDAVFKLVRDGASVLYSPWDNMLAQEKADVFMIPDPQQGAVQVQGFHEPPIRTQVIDAIKTYWVSGGPRRWGMVFRAETKTVYDVEAEYGVQLEHYVHQSEQQKRKHEVELIDHWRWAYKAQAQQPALPGLPEPQAEPKWIVQHAIIVDREFILPLEDTEYLDLPYTIGFFKALDRDKPSDWSHSIIRPLESTLEMMENSINKRQRQINVLASLPLVTKAMAGRIIEIDPALGGHIPLLPDEDIAFPKWPGNPPDVEQQIQFFRSRLQQAGFAEQDLTGGAASGYALSQIGDANKIKLQQPVRALNLLFTNWAKKVLRLTELYGSNMVMRVYGSLKGQDFADQIVAQGLSQYLIKATFKPQFPGEDVRKHAMATQVKGTLSDYTIMQDYLDIDQPDDEEKRIIREQARRHPAMLEYHIRKMLIEMASDGDEAAIMTLMAMQQGGGPGGGGMPAPPNPEQPTGLQSSTGQPTQQAAGGQPPGQGLDDLMNQAAGASPNMQGMI